MVVVPTFVWIVAGIATALAVLGLLNALANETAHKIGVHELRRQVVDLRVRYMHRMIDHYGLQAPDDTIEVEIVDDSSPPERDREEVTRQAAAA